jgi:tetratricopeptide (TPR) repeat protein
VSAEIYKLALALIEVRRDSERQMSFGMFARPIRFSLFAALVLMFGCATLAQSSHMSAGEARITGFVREAGSGKPLTSVRVEVSALGNGVSEIYVTSGTNGEYRIAGVQDGNYDLVVNEKGYKPYREHITLANGNHLTEIIQLEKEDAAAETPGAVLSAHELTVPQKARDLYAKGIALKAKPDYAGALEQFQKAIKIYPTYYEAYAEAGVAEVNLNQLDAAQQDLQKSIDMSEGKYPLAMFYMAGLFNNKRAFDDALTVGKKGNAIDENAWRGNFEIARALIGLKRGDEALPYAKKAVAGAPDNPQMYVVLMNANLGAHDYAAALVAIDAFLKLNPSGQQADQVRHLREQVQVAAQRQAGATGAPAATNSGPAGNTKPH